VSNTFVGDAVEILWLLWELLAQSTVACSFLQSFIYFLIIGRDQRFTLK